MSLNVDKWPILAQLSPEFLQSIRLACVFGGTGNEAILITKDDDVYALGTNKQGCLGLGEGVSSLEPLKVEPLCKKGITGLAYSSATHVLAHTSGGDLFGWGFNGNYELSLQNTTYMPTPTLLRTNLTDIRITTVACGNNHSMVLTSNGEIYAWGYNAFGQIGSGSNKTQPIPLKITTKIGGKRTVAIACGRYSSMAVLYNGKVFGWGFNDAGQLGLGMTNSALSPCQVKGLKGVFIMQIACGIGHTMALSDEGALYTWGGNDCGQLGNGTTTNASVPTRIATDIERIVKIGAINHNFTSTAETKTGRVYMWGQCKGQAVTKPMETRFHSINDVFACYAFPPVTWAPMEVEQNFCTVSDSFSNSFDNPSSSDVKFCVDGRTIHAHKTVLKIRCEYLRAMFENQWAENAKDMIEITHYSYEVYRSFLEYLYTDRVDHPPEDIFGLLDLANSYCERELTHITEKIIKQGITVDNATTVYTTALKYESKGLEDFSFLFIVHHMTDVFQSEDFATIEPSIIKQFVIRAAQEGAFKY